MDMEKQKYFQNTPERSDELFDDMPIASATECTGMGRVLPIVDDDEDGLEDVYTLPSDFDNPERYRH